ncbi:hypothetical protein Dimus_034373 [Dionaea muscipula]
MRQKRSSTDLWQHEGALTVPIQLMTSATSQHLWLGRLRGSAITYRLVMPLHGNFADSQGVGRGCWVHKNGSDWDALAGSIGFGIRIVWEYISLSEREPSGPILEVAGFTVWASLLGELLGVLLSGDLRARESSKADPGEVGFLAWDDALLFTGSVALFSFGPACSKLSVPGARRCPEEGSMVLLARVRGAGMASVEYPLTPLATSSPSSCSPSLRGRYMIMRGLEGKKRRGELILGRICRMVRVVVYGEMLIPRGKKERRVGFGWVFDMARFVVPRSVGRSFVRLNLFLSDLHGSAFLFSCADWRERGCRSSNIQGHHFSSAQLW